MPATGPTIHYTNQGLLDIFYILDNGANFENGDGLSSIYIFAYNTDDTSHWTITGLPSGMSVTALDGFPYIQISGIPSGPGSYSFNVTVTNAYGSDSKDFTLRVGKLGGESNGILESVVHVYVEKTAVIFTTWLNTATSVNPNTINWGVIDDSYLPPYPFVLTTGSILSSTYPGKDLIIHLTDAAEGTYTFPGFYFTPTGAFADRIEFTLVIHIVHTFIPPTGEDISIQVTDRFTLSDNIWLPFVSILDGFHLTDAIKTSFTIGVSPTNEVFSSIIGTSFCPPDWFAIDGNENPIPIITGPPVVEPPSDPPPDPPPSPEPALLMLFINDDGYNLTDNWLIMPGPQLAFIERSFIDRLFMDDIISFNFVSLGPAAVTRSVSDRLTITDHIDLFINITALFKAVSNSFTLTDSVDEVLSSVISQGNVFLMEASNGAPFDAYLTSSNMPWFNTNVKRMLQYHPFWDVNLALSSQYQLCWMYKDSYGIQTSDTSWFSAHSDWVLKDISDNILYLDWPLGTPPYTQYAADISNPAYRAWWIADALSLIQQGTWKGLFVDDVNLEFRIAKADGTSISPKDPNTGLTMAIEAWRGYMATFMEEIRAAFHPRGYEIVHNAIWYAVPANSNAKLARQLAASDVIMIEGGFNDAGITGGTWIFSLQAMLDYIDQIHSLGKGCIYHQLGTSSTDQEFALACYFLQSNETDYLGSTGNFTPSTGLWDGLNTQLGTGSTKTTWNGLRRRDFADGLILVNDPEAAPITVDLPAQYVALDGTLVQNGYTLGAKRGGVLKKHRIVGYTNTVRDRLIMVDAVSWLSIPTIQPPPPTNTATYDVIFNYTTGQAKISAMQFIIGFNSSFTLEAAIGSDAQAAGKNLYTTSYEPGQQRCIVVGLNNASELPNGIMVTFDLTAANPFDLARYPSSIGSIIASSPGGHDVVIGTSQFQIVQRPISVPIDTTGNNVFWLVP